MTNIVKTARITSGKTQNDISKTVGITQAALSLIESGKRKPSVDVAKRLGAALGFEWTQFYEETDGQSASAAGPGP